MVKKETKVIQIAGMPPFLFYCLFFPLLPNTADTLLERQKQLRLSTFTTSFDQTNTARAENISLACRFLDGAKIDGGNSFSFNQRVGERTKERGFQDAAVILDGNFTLGCGGGVCQVSTTLYNAALLAGMEVTESHPHSLQVRYVPPSLDAMVSSYSDLIFFNPRSTPVAIKAQTADGKISISFYGKPDGYTYRTESVILGEIPPPPPLEEVGEEDLTLKEGKSGVRSESYLLRFHHGKLSSRRRLRRDGYAPVQGIVQKKHTAELITPQTIPQTTPQTAPQTTPPSEQEKLPDFPVF